MTNRMPDISPRKAARIAGFGWLIIIIAGIFAEFFIRMQLIVPGDAAATANNIMDSEWLFRISIVSDLIMLAFDVVEALALYVVLKPVNRSLALLAAIFRLVMDAILGINLLNLIVALLLLRGADYLTVFETDQLHAQALLFLNAHSSGYDLALVFFGLSLLVLGYLVFKSGYFPRVLGVLLIVASFGYLIDSLASFLLPNYDNYEAIFALVVFLPAFIGELSMCLWLLLKGVKVQQS